MWFFVAILSVLSLVHSNVSGLEVPIEGRSRIVGGEDADIKDFPHQISLHRNGEHKCGGSIYKSNIIITAGHCVTNKSAFYSIVAGSTLLNETHYMEANVKKVISHEKYNKIARYDYDVAILVLDRHFKFDENVQPIRLANRTPADGSKVTAIGWGMLSYPGPYPNNLQKVDVEIVNHSECRKSYSRDSKIVTDRMICAALDGKDSCKADSGGPLINADRELLGIVSWGKDCAVPGYPGIYASVPNLYNWIVKTVEDNEDL